MDIETQKKYRKVWDIVEAEYQEGFCVSERGLQAALASALKEKFPEKKVVIEPVWEIHSQSYIPDIVLVNDTKILDVFELKFVPHSFAEFERDVEKLAEYSTCSNGHFPVRLNPHTGQWTCAEESLREDCQFHFVAVARADAAAVYTESVKVGAKLSGTGRLHHWYGPVGTQESSQWGIKFGI